ncbi:MAG: AraC family transcriptional regulator [Bacteroides sp.]|nr:AraC family transcriptional regulator [Bacteroides sp.]
MERKKEGFEGQMAIVLPQTIKDILTSNELTSLLHITDIGYYPKAEGHYRSRKEGVDQHILIYCTDGKGWINIHNTRYNLKKEEFFIIEAGTPHSYGAAEKEPWSIYWIHFSGEKSHLFSSIYNKVIRIEDSPEARFGDRLLMFEEIYKNLEMGYSTENLEYVTHCLWHFIASFRFIPQFREVNKSKKGDIIQDSIKYMKENINKHLTLEDIAKHVHYSSSHFGQIFLKKTGHSPLNYFSQLKIQKACQMLDFTEMKIKEISFELGFYDPYHFSKTFFKITGETPSQYKKRNKG